MPSPTLPTVIQTWSFSTNNRISYVSLNDTMARFLFGLKNFLVATMGYTVKYTCDGTTGPTSGSDHTDRWASFANCTTRGTAAGNAQSFAVLTDGQGADILLAYQGNADSRCKVAWSNGAHYTPAGTANQQPTATDETPILSNAQDVIGTATSGDRIWHAMARGDKQGFRVFIYSAGALVYWFSIESVQSAVLVSFAWSPPVVGFASTNATPAVSSGASFAGNGHVLSWGSAAVGNGAWIRISGQNLPVNGGGEVFASFLTSGGWSNPFSTYNPELQAGAIIVGLNLASQTASLQGHVGDRMDMWFPYTNTYNQGDMYGNFQFCFLGTALHPWNGQPVVLR